MGQRTQHTTMEIKGNQAHSRSGWFTKVTLPVCHNPNLRRSALPESVKWLTTSWGPRGTGDGKVWKKRRWGGPGAGEPAMGSEVGMSRPLEAQGPAWKASSSPGIISSVQPLRRVRLFGTPWTAARQASLSFTSSRSPLKLKSIEWVMPSNHLILCRPLLLCLQYFPASGLFQGVSSSYEVAKVLEFQLQHQSFQ